MSEKISASVFMEYEGRLNVLKFYHVKLSTLDLFQAI